MSNPVNHKETSHLVFPPLAHFKVDHRDTQIKKQLRKGLGEGHISRNYFNFSHRICEI